MKMTKEQRQMYNLFCSAIRWDKVKENEQALDAIFSKPLKQLDKVTAMPKEEEKKEDKIR